MEYNLWLKTWQVPYLLITFPILYKVRRQGANEDIIFKIECWLCPCDPLHPLCHLTLPAQSNQVTTSSLLVQDQATSSLPQLICMWSEGGSGWDNWGVFKSDRHEVRHQESLIGHYLSLQAYKTGLLWWLCIEKYTHTHTHTHAHTQTHPWRWYLF